jgi:hypothetical protein
MSLVLDAWVLDDDLDMPALRPYPPAAMLLSCPLTWQLTIFTA